MTSKKKTLNQEFVKGSTKINASSWKPKSSEIVGPLDQDRFVLDVINGKADIDITESMIDGSIQQTIEGASSITMTVRDFDRRMLKSGVLSDGKGNLKTVDVPLPNGTIWRLVKFRKVSNDIEFTFEEREVALLRVFKGPRKVRRIVVGLKVKDGMTRAQFVLSLIKRSKKYPIKTSIRELNQLQSTDEVSRTKSGKAKEDKNRGKGFPKGVKFPGVDAQMLENITVFLTRAEKEKAPELAIMAGLCAGFGESGWSKKAVSPSGKHKGVFQSTTIPPEDLDGQSKYFLIGGRSFLKGGAMGLARSHPEYSPGLIATKTEISDGSAAHYDKHRPIARRILKEWGGAPSGSSKTAVKKYEFSVGADETYWDAIIRLAGEVGRRAFVVAGVFYWISEDDLYKSRVRYRFSEDTDGIENIDFDMDYGKMVATASVSCRIDQWEAPPGTVVLIDDMGAISEARDDKSDESRKWLVSTINRSLFTKDATIVLKKPMAEAPEPNEADAQTDTTNRGATGGGKDLGNGLVYPLAEHGKSLGGVAAHKARPFGNWQSDNAVDIGVKRGVEVYAVCTGKITRLGGAWRGGSGNPDGYNVTISGGGRSWFYTHLQSRSNLTVGQQVTKGDLLGKSGAANGVDHLHIGVDKGDPEKLLKV